MPYATYLGTNGLYFNLNNFFETWYVSKIKQKSIEANLTYLSFIEPDSFSHNFLSLVLVYLFILLKRIVLFYSFFLYNL